MGQEASFEELPWPRALELVFRGERDALFTALRNDERVRFCYFPDEPLLPVEPRCKSLTAAS
jgi:polar amino acid transport system substrate-binding protein